MPPSDPRQEKAENEMRLLQGAPRWAPATLDRRLQVLAQTIQSGVFVPWYRYVAVGKAWASHPQAHRLLEAFGAAFAQTDSYSHGVFEGARITAIDRQDLVLLNALKDPRFAWTPVAQAKAYLQVLAQNDRQALDAWFWTAVPPEGRAPLYRALAQQNATLPKGAQALLAAHRTAPHAILADLEAGVNALFAQICGIDMGTDPDLSQELEVAWGLLRAHVRPEAIWSSLWAHMGTSENPALAPNTADLLLADLLLAEVSQALQATWLEKSGLDLPRTRAAHRRHRLDGLDSLPATPRRTRRRS